MTALLVARATHPDPITRLSTAADRCLATTATTAALLGTNHQTSTDLQMMSLLDLLGRQDSLMKWRQPLQEQRKLQTHHR